MTFPGGRRRHRFAITVYCTSVYYCHVASSWKSNNGNNFTLQRLPHEADITVATAERSPWLINSFWGHVLGSIGRKQIHSIFSEVPPSHHAGIHCAHTCVKLKLSWPYIWLRMLFLLLKGFICRNISGDTFSRFGGRGLAGEGAGTFTVGDVNRQKWRLSRCGLACECVRAHKLVCEYPYSSDVWRGIQ